MTADPQTVPCSYCGANPGVGCMAVSGWARKPHAPRAALALALSAHADPALDAFFPRLGPCGLCGVAGMDQRHRLVDSAAGMLAAGERAETVGREFGLRPEAVEAVAAWAQRWPGVWL